MAIVPLLVNLARELDTEYSPLAGDLDHLLDDDFGFGIHPMEIFRSSRPSLLLHPRRRHLPYDRHHHALARRGAALRHVGGGVGRDEGSSSQLLPTIGNEGFQVCMDVSKFKPNELSVKTVDKTIVVEGKHEEREDDHGLIQRHFVRKYTLPKDYDPQDVISTISSDGVLTVKAPPPPGKAIKQNERIVQIQQTGPAHLSVKAPEQPQLQDGNVKSVDQAQNGGKQQNKMETGK